MFWCCCDVEEPTGCAIPYTAEYFDSLPDIMNTAGEQYPKWYWGYLQNNPAGTPNITASSGNLRMGHIYPSTVGATYGQEVLIHCIEWQNVAVGWYWQAEATILGFEDPTGYPWSNNSFGWSEFFGTKFYRTYCAISVNLFDTFGIRKTSYGWKLQRWFDITSAGTNLADWSPQNDVTIRHRTDCESGSYPSFTVRYRIWMNDVEVYNTTRPVNVSSRTTSNVILSTNFFPGYYYDAVATDTSLKWLIDDFIYTQGIGEGISLAVTPEGDNMLWNDGDNWAFAE